MERLKASIVADMAGSWSAAYEDGSGSYTITMKPSRRVGMRKDDLACPNGGLVLNALRVSDTMVIYEAQVFADTADRNPLASVTATKRADKAKGEAYIHAAQEAALEGALSASGFSLEVSLLARTVGISATAAQPSQTDGGEQPVETAESSPAPAADETAQQPKPAAGAAPRPAPVGPPPHAAPRPAPRAGGPSAPRCPGLEERGICFDCGEHRRCPPAVGGGRAGWAERPARTRSGSCG